MVVALAMLHPLPPSELAALVLVASEATTDSNRKIIIDYLGVNPGGSLEQLSCWLTPACQTGKLRNSCTTLPLVDPSLPDGQAAKLLHHFVVYPMVDVLSVEQKHGLGIPPSGHWWVEFPTCTYISFIVNCVKPLACSTWMKLTCAHRNESRIGLGKDPTGPLFKGEVLILPNLTCVPAVLGLMLLLYIELTSFTMLSIDFLSGWPLGNSLLLAILVVASFNAEDSFFDSMMKFA